MPFLLVLLVALMCQEGIHSKPLNSLIGPFIAYAERFYLCEPDNHPLPWSWHLRVTHFNPYKPRELQLVTGNVTFANIKVVADNWSNNQWKENAFIFYFRRNACQAVRTNIPGFYESVLKKETKGACAVKGVYEVNNTPVNWTFPNVPIMPYANYRLRIMLGKAENVHGCVAVDCKIVPKFE
ncbi:uncharacterized protein LOC113206000 isoform X2 [Frankliniella occidentalis]|uniref:Uncharacterized protein LOC113206000 isoform X2 n=1 Tax=Frankliniella occidentalis TaxID=133901 RepID=A0A9C6U3A3_FRAOC|nr:uncharacterized protein LOC113206000 isoform X2 [Frankliniella occidentalis]